MAVPPEAATNSSAPPSSNAASKTPASSRKYISDLLLMFCTLILKLYYNVFRVSMTESQQIAFQPSQHLKHSGTFPIMITHQAMHT
jgi:hypothetical protein